MKAKLFKTGNQYLLRDETGETLAITNGTIKGKMLSLKNCQAIELGYDLDELAKDHIKEKYNTGLDTDDEEDIAFSSFQEGFRKAIEILGDKKFSEQDLLDLMSFILVNTPNHVNSATIEGIENDAKFYIQSLQTKEWDVEIEMEDVFMKNSGQYVDEVGVGNYSTHSKKPKLDENNCLILKRV